VLEVLVEHQQHTAVEVSIGGVFDKLRGRVAAALKCLRRDGHSICCVVGLGVWWSTSSTKQ
jgi:hypothetical protein